MTNPMGRTSVNSTALRLWAALWPVILVIGLYVVLTATGIAGARLLDLEHGALPAGSSEEARQWPGVWARWDSGYYLAIAREGYDAENATPAFYPLYPLLIRFVSSMGLSPLAAGTLLSLVFYGVALIVLRHTLRKDYDASVCCDTDLLLALFPMALFFFAIYTEALFLFLSVLAYSLARSHRWIWALIICFLAGSCRDNGFLVGALVAGEALTLQGRVLVNRQTFLQSGLLVIPGVVGFLSYHAYLWFRFGDPLLSLRIHNEIGQRFVTWPWISVWDTIQLAVFGKGVEGNWFWRLVGWQELAFTGLFVVLAILAWKLVRPSLALYLSLSMIMFTASHGPYGMGLMSTPRYVLPLFPGFLVMAILLRDRRWCWVVLVGSLVLLLWYTFWFGSGRWVA